MVSSKYPKLNKQENCAFPEREICNWSEDGKIKRCIYMKYNNLKNIFDSTRWGCTYKNTKKSLKINRIKKIIKKEK